MHFERMCKASGKTLRILSIHEKYHWTARKPIQYLFIKEKNRDDPLNYRPVSLTTVIWKLRKILKKRSTQFLEKLRDNKALVGNVISCYRLDKL